MALVDIARRFKVFLDPEDNTPWIYDTDGDNRWTRCDIAIQLLRVITAILSKPPPPLHPPPPTKPPHVPPPPHYPPPPLCHSLRHHLHSDGMYNGMPWETQQSIGRDLTVLNWISLDDGICQSARHRSDIF